MSHSSATFSGLNSWNFLYTENLYVTVPKFFTEQGLIGFKSGYESINIGNKIAAVAAADVYKNVAHT